MSNEELDRLWQVAMRQAIEDGEQYTRYHFAKLVLEHEREAIKDEWWMCVQSDLEHGVKSLNEKAATDWHSNYPAMAGFGSWLEERSDT